MSSAPVKDIEKLNMAAGNELMHCMQLFFNTLANAPEQNKPGKVHKAALLPGMHA